MSAPAPAPPAPPPPTPTPPPFVFLRSVGVGGAPGQQHEQNGQGSAENPVPYIFLHIFASSHPKGDPPRSTGRIPIFRQPPFRQGRGPLLFVSFDDNACDPFPEASMGGDTPGTFLNAVCGDTHLPHPGDESGMSPVGVSPPSDRGCPRGIASSETAERTSRRQP